MFRVLIIGAGNIASGYDNPESECFLTHAHAFSTHPGFELIGFVDPNTNNAEVAAKKWKVNAFSNIDQALASYKDIDVFCITVPDHLHYNLLRQVAEYNPKLVFTEKPLTDTLNQALIIQKLYKDLNIPILINFKRAFVPEIIEIIQKVKQNAFGELKSCFAFYNRGLKHNGSHMIDLFTRFTDCKSLVLKQIIDSLDDYSKHDLSYSIVAETDMGASFILKSFDGVEYPIFELDLHYKFGRIRLFNTGEKIEVYRVQTSNSFNGYQFLQPISTINTSIHRSMYFSANNIHEYLTSGKSLLASLEDGIRVIHLTEQIIKEINNKSCQN